MSLHEAKIGNVHAAEFYVIAPKSLQEDQWVQSSHGMREASSMGPPGELSL